MLVEHRGARPSVDPSAYVAPTAVLCGDVRVGAGTSILFGAVVTAEDGPHAHLNGTDVGDGCFLATGASLFPGSRLGRAAEVRINGVVHVNTVLADEAMVPIGWVAVGDPARILPPGDHEEIWKIQAPLDFPQTVYGVPRETPPRERMQRQSDWFAAHRGDQILT